MKKLAPAPGNYVDEIVLAAALVLLTVGLWSRLGAVALVAPGLVLLWIALPSRRAFLVTQPSSESAGAKGRT